MKLTDKQLLQYNHQGFIPGPGESEAAYLKRIEYCLSFETTLKEELGEEIPFTKEETPSKEFLEEAHPLTEQLFGIAPNWVPLFFSNHKLPFWQGGAAWIVKLAEETPTSTLFQLRKKFYHSPVYLGIYERKELIAHELAHVGRMVFEEPLFEEFFAYQTAQTRFRKWAGPLMQSSRESAFFVLALCALLFTQLVFPFSLPTWWLSVWLAPVGYLFFTFGRLAKRWCQLNRCLHHLRELVGDPLKALQIAYRLKDSEIIDFAKSTPEKIREYLEAKKESTPRHRLLFLYLE